MTKPQFEAIAKEALKDVPKSDKPMRLQEWHYLTDTYCKQGDISSRQYNSWTVPNWVVGGYQ